MPKWGPSNPLWRWQHRRGRKTTRRKRRAHTKAPTVRTMARRRYGRRRGGRRNILSKLGGISGIGAMIYGADQLGAITAVQNILAGGDIAENARVLGAKATASNVITALVPSLLVFGTKKVVRGAGIRLPAWL